jgi:hypothetical protein
MDATRRIGGLGAPLPLDLIVALGTEKPGSSTRRPRHGLVAGGPVGHSRLVLVDLPACFGWPLV